LKHYKSTLFVFIAGFILNSFSAIGQDDVIQDTIGAEEILEEYGIEPDIAVEEYVDDPDVDFGTRDTKSYNSETIDEATLQDYKERGDFQYKRKGDTALPRQPNWLRRFFNAIYNLLSNTFGFDVPNWLFAVLKWLFFIGVGVAAVYFLARVTGVNINFKKQKKKVIEEISFETIEENLEEVNFDHLLEQAIKERSYRVAVRLFFLKNLQNLTKQDFINWAIDKTNNDYKYELTDSNLLTGFENTVYLFEHIWYGHFDLTEPEFQSTLNTFRNFQNKIRNEK